mgnify:CR=1 FL=1
MIPKILTLVRGLPGSGKSTFANTITNEFSVCEADKFFYDKEGNYNFDATKLTNAHQWCREQVEIRMKDNQANYQFYPHIVVSNTFTQEWEMADDLGDSSPASLQQGGSLPSNSRDCRVVGRIFPDSASALLINIYPENPNKKISRLMALQLPLGEGYFVSKPLQ